MVQFEKSIGVLSLTRKLSYLSVICFTFNFIGNGSGTGTAATTGAAVGVGTGIYFLRLQKQNIKNYSAHNTVHIFLFLCL